MTTPPTSPNSPSASPIAVIGLACRLPGGIDSPQRFWEALLRGADFIDEVPGDRWDVEAYYGSEPGAPGRSVSRWGGFLDTIGAFDADFFGMTEPEAIAVDPQHRLLLETSWEAVEHAGVDPAALARSQTGVFVGLTHSDYELLSAECGAAEGPYGFTATSSSFASARVSRALGLHGPAVTVDTACSSGLMAVHQACRSLQVGESELALAGGVSVMLEPRRSVAGSQQGMLSPTGRCRAFDAAADGFVAGEGCVVLLLKRLPEAIRDHNRILAVLRGSAANQDGSAGTAAAPSKPALVEVYQAALAAAGVEAATVELVEAHGLGNPSADLTEYAGLAAVYGTDDRCFLGSVKTNFGHCQSASGPLGLMKAILALQNGTVPQHLHFTRLPDQLAGMATNLVVPRENMTWPTKAGHPRRAAVSAHGLSGTNVHVIVEQPPVPALPDAATESATEVGGQAPLLFPISATSADQLRATSARLADWVDEHGTAMSPADLGYTLARRRSHRPVRTAVAASNFVELGEALREIADNDLAYPPAIGPDGRGPVWVFSEQAPPWTPMAALLAEEPAFAAAIAKMEPVVAEESGFSLAETIAAAVPPTEVERVQPTNFAIQVALAEAMKAHGVRPGAVIGHSLGETAAAVVAGGLTLEDGLRVACRRSRLLARIVGSGAMANVELPAQQVLSELSIRDISDAVLAVVESPVSTTIGGDGQTVRELVAAWQQQGVPAREVAVAVAAHTSQVEPVLDELAQALADVKPTEPEIPYYSATLWSPRDRPAFDGQYWADNLRYMARFAAAAQAAIKDGYRVFGELASHPRLAAVLEQNAGSLDVAIAALVAIPPERQSCNGLRGFVADLHSAGAAVDFAAHYPSGKLVEAPLPSWNHRELIFSREDADTAPRGAAIRAVHPLLGAHVHLLEEPERHVWQGDVGLVGHPWLDDHRVHNMAVLPGAAYCEMALAAARTSLGESAEVRDLRFEQMLSLDDWTSVSSGAAVVAPGVLDFGVHTHQGRDRVDCATAVLAAPPDVPQPSVRDIAALLAAHQTRLDGDDLRKAADRDGIQYGPAFAGLAVVHVGDSRHTIGATALAEVALPGPTRSQQGLYEIHPALLEACIMAAAMRPDIPRAGDGGLLRPVGVHRLRRHHLIREVRYCLSTVTAVRADACEADLELMDGSGNVLLTVEGLQFAAGRSQSESAQRTLDERLLTIEWERRDQPVAASTDAGSWLLLSTADAPDALTGRLGRVLNGEGTQSVTVSTPMGRGHGADGIDEVLNGRTGVVVVTPPALNGSHPPQRGRDLVAYLLDVVRQMVALPGESPRLYVVTRDAAAVRPGDRPNLEQAGLRGLIRVVDSEYPHLKVTQIDVDGSAAEQDGALAAHLAAQLRSGSEEDETAWRDGDWYTARLRPGPLGPADRRTTVVEHGHDCLRLQRSDSTEPETWEPVAHPRIAPGSGQIEVAVRVAGVDWAQASPVEPGLQQLGPDFAGVVTAVGPDVTGHRVGDHVAGISPDGCWATFITCDARLVATLPAELPLTEAAAWPTAYATAWYGLHHLARVTSDDKVLIHRATSGVGRAAIAIARAAGCQVFATADSPQRRELLRDMGIEHVYDSSNLEFADRIRHDTDGYGVDVVLNSLSGVAQRAGIELLSFGGRFIELGRRDVYGDTRLGLFPFRRNLSLHVVDMALLAHSHPETVQRLLCTVYRNAADGRLPQPQTTHHPLLDAAEVLRLADGDDCAATVLLDAPPAGSTVAVIPPAQARLYRADGSYIVTGGTGGPGLYLAAEMAAAGCGRIVLNGESAPDSQAQQAIDRLRALGADIQVECGDIAEPQTADRLVAAATASGLPVRGVLHAVAAVGEAPLTEITDHLVDHSWSPKVHGAWNLHQSLQEAAQPLDWFCAFSSTSALIGSPGQGAAAAADSWLDAFGRWRQAQGLPATVIGWGPWADTDTGSCADSDDGVHAAITCPEAARAFDAVLSYGRAYAGYAPITRAPWLAALAHRSPFAEAFRPVRRSSPDAQRFLAELKEIPREEWLGTILRLISDQISLLLRRTVDPDRPLPEYGLDSLASLEFRTRIETETGVRVGPAQLTTVRGVSQHVCDQLAARVEPADSPGGG
ncbi:sulfolipid-1 biosynthesis phthioceranic/hydroxyphthioceranic acid synthase [Mycolicibacter hiberniae]|uniref:Polyketide synthase n=1 Tax=Mycolicibacter hiberniae TaxID=29314 RepID=A0A7I7X5R1_9MYCO|nr:type I polyketide synthase [Mycolicibacter hiberniae]MCV7088313.1 type I polyketide synthase [Mycolicibacter hiberniae]ORV68851.1 polyketide synthase [Mycolicibacter hiberniae]BBZ25169.1 polyketide synthase [Mycolicibacter hiberniae]